MWMRGGGGNAPMVIGTVEFGQVEQRIADGWLNTHIEQMGIIHQHITIAHTRIRQCRTIHPAIVMPTPLGITITITITITTSHTARRQFHQGGRKKRLIGERIRDSNRWSSHARGGNSTSGGGGGGAGGWCIRVCVGMHVRERDETKPQPIGS